MKPVRYPLLVLILVIFLSNCNMPGRGGSEKGIMATLARQTVSAKLTQAFVETQNASGIFPTSTNPAETGDTTPSQETPTPANTATQGPPPTNTPLPCYWAQFVTDVTVPDDTQFVAGTVFTKTWRLRNVGTCNWTSGFRLIFDNGDQMNAPFDSQFTTGVVSPGAQVDISVVLTAPTSPGTYIGFYKLRSSDNLVFGTGAKAEGNFWVRIVVLAPSATATITPTSTETPTPTMTNTPLPTAAPSDTSIPTAPVTPSATP